MFRCRTSEFKASRKHRKEVGDVKEHRLLQRLEKLLFHGPPSQPTTQRKEYEQRVVPWLDESKVPRCPECTARFSLTRRKHHCRLCGAVICFECSLALEVSVAVKLTVMPELTNKKLSKKEAEYSRKRQIAIKQDRLVLDSSDAIRICPFCQTVLVRSQVRQNNDSQNKEESPIARIYQEMKEAENAIQRKLPDYNSFIQRVISSGAVGLYSDARAMRSDIMEHFDTLRRIGKAASDGKVMDLNGNPSSLKILRNMSVHIREVLQLFSVAMANLPSEDDLLEIADARRQEEEEEVKRHKLQEKNIQEQRRQIGLLQEDNHKIHNVSDTHENLESNSEENRTTRHRNKQRLKKTAPEVSSANNVFAPAEAKNPNSERERQLVSSTTENHQTRRSWKPRLRKDKTSHFEADGDKGDTCDQFTSDADMDALLESEKRSLLSYLRSAQKSGRTDEVEILKAQLQQLELFRMETALHQ